MKRKAHLRITNLRSYFYSKTKQAFIRSVDGVDLQVNRNETLGIVGESGSGKSISMLSAMGLLAAEPGVIEGEVLLQTKDAEINLLQGLERYVQIEKKGGRIHQVIKNDQAWKSHVNRLLKDVRGKEIAMIFQNPNAAMNPFETIGKQISEVIRLHTGRRQTKEIRERTFYWLDRVKFDSPQLRYHSHPYGLSGGMCQRAMLAMALATEASLLIADEPTTGLDATIQSRILDLLAEIKRDYGMTMILISHDIGVITRLADTVAVMYGGRVMETGPVDKILLHSEETKHPYTAALLRSIPNAINANSHGYLHAIDGDVLDTINTPCGCRFLDRCNQAHGTIREKCQGREPEFFQVSTQHKIRCWLFENASVTPASSVGE